MDTAERTQEKVVELFDKLVGLRREEEPTISYLAAECPELPSYEWIIRYGPAQEWESIAARYDTADLHWLIRVLVTTQRELRWIGGSVAAPIWLFRAYRDRPASDADELADWVLANRGSHYYLPFGSPTRARSLREWREEQSKLARRSEERRAKEAARQAADRVRRQERQITAKKRELDSKRRAGEIEVLLKKLESMTPAERLSFIAWGKEVPLGAIPDRIILSALDAASHLTADTRSALLQRIDRRKSNGWTHLRNRLVSLSASGASLDRDFDR